MLAGLESRKPESKGSVEQAQLYKKACDVLEIERAGYMDRLRLNSYASCSKVGDVYWLGRGAARDKKRADRSTMTKPVRTHTCRVPISCAPHCAS